MCGNDKVSVVVFTAEAQRRKGNAKKCKDKNLCVSLRRGDLAVKEVSRC